MAGIFLRPWSLSGQRREIRRACVLEAEHLIRRLRHHPCLLLWCGGNETIMGAQFQHQPPFGAEIVLEN